MIGYMLLLMLTGTGCLGFLIVLSAPSVGENLGTGFGIVQAITGVLVICLTAYITNVVQS